MFVLHASTSVSRWCWLFSSTLRYAAVYHPLWHRRQWRLGHRTLPYIIFISAVVSAFLLFTVESRHSLCTESSLSHERQVNRWLHAIELTWSYWTPVCIMTVLDVRVLFLQPPRLSSLRNNILPSSMSFNSESNTVTSSRSIGNRSQSQMAVYHWLGITSINLLLSGPDVVIRIAVLYDMDAAFLFNPTFALISRFMFFAQFCVNASYLSMVVFRVNTNSHGRMRNGKKWAEFSALIASLNVEIVNSLQRLEPWSDFEGYHL